MHMHQPTFSNPDYSGHRWLEIVLYLSDIQHLSAVHLERWVSHLHTVRVVAPVTRPDYVPDDVLWYSYDDQAIATNIWNSLIHESSAPWILFLRDDEYIRLNELPRYEELRAEEWIPAQIHVYGELLQRYFQVRLVPNIGMSAFHGHQLPDATRFIRSAGMQQSDITIPIHRKTPLFETFNAEAELASQEASPQTWLVLGDAHFKDGKYAYAAGLYRRLTKIDLILPFDRLAAINGLASCYAEMYKWKEASDLCEKSVAEEQRQRLPYLIRFRIAQLEKRWSDAHDILDAYTTFSRQDSKANFDREMTRVDLLTQLADMAFRSGMHATSFGYYESLFELKNGEVPSEHLRLLYFFSLELDNIDKAIHYFTVAFGNKIPHAMDDETKPVMVEWLNQFIEKGWLDYPIEIYRQFFDYDPSHPEYRRHLVAVLSKNKDLEKARNLLNRKVMKIKS
jgi:tetratricopeptide (TPR) repeat protein